MIVVESVKSARREAIENPMLRGAIVLTMGVIVGMDRLSGPFRDREKESGMVRMIVVCAGDGRTRFDRDYYANKHLALARECWGPHGLEEADAFFPAGAGDGWLSIGVYRFRSRGDVDAAFAAPETARVMADVANFTDTTDIRRSIFEPL